MAENCEHKNILKGIGEDCCKDCNTILPRASIAAPQKDLRIRDREGNVVTQGAFNALMVRVDSLTEDAELAAEDADRLRGELGTVYANMLRAAPESKCMLCGHEQRFYNAEADACEHTTGLTQAQFDMFCGCACRFVTAEQTELQSLRDENKRLRDHIADLNHDLDAAVKECNEHHG